MVTQTGFKEVKLWTSPRGMKKNRSRAIIRTRSWPCPRTVVSLPVAGRMALSSTTEALTWGCALSRSLSVGFCAWAGAGGGMARRWQYDGQCPAPGRGVKLFRCHHSRRAIARQLRRAGGEKVGRRWRELSASLTVGNPNESQRTLRNASLQGTRGIAACLLLATCRKVLASV